MLTSFDIHRAELKSLRTFAGAVVSGGYKTDFNLNNIIATLSFISSVKNSPANAVKISAVILNLASDKPDSDKPEKINISLLSGCCL